MTDEHFLPRGADAFVAACLDAPEDAQVRLVFADWLDDRADPRAARLRSLVRAWEAAAELSVAARGPHDGRAALEHLARGYGEASCRLAACLCVRFCPDGRGSRVWARLTDPGGRRAVAAAELHACRLASDSAVAAEEEAALRALICDDGEELTPAEPHDALLAATLAAGPPDLVAWSASHAADVGAGEDDRRDARMWCAALADALPGWCPEFTWPSPAPGPPPA